MRKSVFLYAKFFLLAMTMAVLPSCSDDDELGNGNDGTDINFPSVESGSSDGLQPGDTYELSFDAELDWKLSSSAMWVLFSNDVDTIGSLILEGSAGSQTITVYITDDGWTVEESTAEITLTMGDESLVIDTVTRAGMPLAVYDSETDGVLYSDENPVTVTYSSGSSTTDYTTVSLYANFAWTLTEIPEWLTMSESLPTSANAYQLAEISLSVNEDYIVDARTDYLVLRSQSDESKSFSVPVVYSGLAEGQIIVKFNNATISNAYNWTISQDGTELSTTNEMTGVTSTYSLPLSMTVSAVDNDYTVVQLAQMGQWWYANDPDYTFINVNDTGSGNVTVSFDENTTGSSRGGCILVMPESLYSDVVTNSGNGAYMFIDNNGDGENVYEGYLVKNASGIWRQVSLDLVETGEDNEYTDMEKFKPSTYVKLSFTQQISSSSDGDEVFSITSSPSASFTLVSDADASVYGTTNVYKCVLSKDQAYSEFQITSDQYPYGEYYWMGAADVEATWAATSWTSSTYTYLMGGWSVNSWSFQYADTSWNTYYNGIAADHGASSDLPYGIVIMDEDGSMVAVLLLEREK